MDFHYSALQMVFDGWIVVVLLVWAVVAAVKLRSYRRLSVVGGLVLWILATLLWMPGLLGWLLMPLAGLLGPDWVWQLPTVPWLVGAVLVAVGVLLPVRSAGQRAGARSYPPPREPAPPNPPPPDIPPPDFPPSNLAPPAFPPPNPDPPNVRASDVRQSGSDRR